MVSRFPRQIVAFEVDKSVNAKALQKMVDSVPSAERYFVDGCSVYRDVDYLGLLRQNFEDKSDTHNIESTNSDLRHYIPGLRRRSRCFYRSIETLRAILSIFVTAYNKFGEAKLKRRKKLIETYGIGVKLHNWYKEPNICLFDFI